MLNILTAGMLGHAHGACPCVPTLKIPPSLGGSGAPSNTWLLGPIRADMPNGISIGSAVLQGTSMLRTDRHTQIPRHERCSNRPHLYAVHIRCGLREFLNIVFEATFYFYICIFVQSTFYRVQNQPLWCRICRGPVSYTHLTLPTNREV